MRVWTLGIVMSLLLAATASAQAPNAELFAVIQKFADSFNKGDVPVAASTHAADADLVIIDEVSPFLWRGAGAFQAWITDLDNDAKQHGITDQMVTIRAASRTEASGDQAYVVVPAVYTFKQRGVAMREAAQMTFTLRKGPGGWLIHGWTWTGPKATAAAK